MVPMTTQGDPPELYRFCLAHTGNERTAKAGRFRIALYFSSSSSSFLSFIFLYLLLLFHIFFSSFSPSHSLCDYVLFFFFFFSFHSFVQSLEIGQLRTPTWRQVECGTRRQQQQQQQTSEQLSNITLQSSIFRLWRWRCGRSPYANIAIKPSPDVVCARTTK